MEPLEITDCIVSFDPLTLARRDVLKDTLVEAFRVRGDRSALRLLRGLDARDGVVDPVAVDSRLIRIHAELQRISEEFQHGLRVAELLRPVLAAMRGSGVPAPIRLVDIGCGTGYVVRWLAARGELGNDVALVGADLNDALVNEAQRLAEAEDLAVTFVRGDALGLAEGAHLYLSTGLLHHFRGDDLLRFMRCQDRPQTHAFLHFDFQPSVFAGLGAWLFHLARMRDALGRHDGVLSARRAHDGRTLLAAARAGAPSFRVGLFGPRLWRLPIPRVFHALLGVRPHLAADLERHMGRRRSRLAWA